MESRRQRSLRVRLPHGPTRADLALLALAPLLALGAGCAGLRISPRAAPEMTQAGAAAGSRLTARDAGLYVGTAADYMYGQVPFTFSIDQVSRRSDPAGLRRTVERLHANGKRSILDIFLYEKGDETAKPAAEYMAWLDPLLAQLPLDKVYAITLSEENIYWNGHGEMLRELYGLVKAKYPSLAVYQWYSPGASAPGFGWPLLPADGWLIDEYCAPRARFADLVKKYTLLDKPLIHIAWAAPDWKEFASWDKVWDDQLAICRGYGVPIAFFCWWPPNGDPPPPGNQSLWSWSAPPGSAHHRVWNQRVLPYVQRLRRGLRAREDADSSRGRVIEVAGDEQDGFSYHEDFRTAPRFVDDADIEGFLGLRWTGQRLEIKPGRVATLTYCFTSPFTLHDVRAALDGEGLAPALTLGISADGRHWVTSQGAGPTLEAVLPEAAGRQGFLVRVALSGQGRQQAALTDLRISARVDPPAVPQVVLIPGRDGQATFTDEFRSQRYLHAGRVTNPTEIKWVPGALRLYGKAGYVNEASVDYHFVCTQPLQEVQVKLACAADKADFGARVALALSTDGQTFTAPASTEADGKPKFHGELVAGPGPGASPVGEFWVRITLTNTCGAATKTPSPTVQRLTVQGRVAR